MSTKTTLKRVALVAVSALGFGLLAVVPARAAALTGAAVTSSTVNASIAATGTVTVRLDLSAEAIGDTLAFTWDNLANVAEEGDYSWKILEHSASVLSNAYQGAGSTATTSIPGFTLTYQANAVGYVLLQISVSGGAIADNLDLDAGSDNVNVVNLDIADTAGTATSYPASIANATDTPWRINETYADSTSKANLASLTGSETVTAATNDVRIIAAADTVQKAGAGSYRYVEVTGSTIKAVAGAVVIDGLANTATKAIVLPSGDLLDGATGAEVWVNAGSAGTVTVKFIDRSYVALTGAFYETVLQTITFTITAPGALSAQTSYAYMHALQSSTTGVATSQSSYAAYEADFADFDCSTAAGIQACDFTVIAPATADAVTPKAVIQVTLLDALSVPL